MVKWADDDFSMNDGSVILVQCLLPSLEQITHFVFVGGVVNFLVSVRRKALVLLVLILLFLILINSCLDFEVGLGQFKFSLIVQLFQFIILSLNRFLLLLSDQQVSFCNLKIDLNLLINILNFTMVFRSFIVLLCQL